MTAITLADMFRAAPVRSALVTALPLILAAAQVANSVVNDLPFLVSIPFAAVLVAATALLTQCTFFQFRRKRLEDALRL